MYLGNFIASVIGYCIGSLLFGKIIVYLKTSKNLEDYGSGNLGATNASRVIGKWWGFGVFLLDYSKIFVTAFIALGFSLINSPLFYGTSVIIPCVFCFIGHIYPIFNKFKGGKGVSSFSALLFIVNWYFSFLFIIIWWILTLTINKISFSGIASVIILAILIWIPILNGFANVDSNLIWKFNSKAANLAAYFEKDFVTNIFNHIRIKHFLNINNDFQLDSYILNNILITLCGLVVIVKHKTNIKRLLNGTEPSWLTWRQKMKEKKLDK
ncbi:glycerol-3-phosphate acyltransferase [Spiroplasma endosymbiont of Crioceris asparagi]|uniref:glycerol-3-phosphate acyltransferase n=1 Tax=Spiroplasma endosymbiont of Crioceris asparagi TaxID=3066286 RepID=UPI0030D350E7